MIKNKYVFVTILLAAILVVSSVLTTVYTRLGAGEDGAEDDLIVVTSFYPMYVAAENVIGDCQGITLKNLSEPQTGCMHDYQLTAEDMKLLSTADVFVVNGGGIETFLSDVAAQCPQLTIVNACDGMELLEDNAHAWMNPFRYCEQVDNICSGLCEMDESQADSFRVNAKAYKTAVCDVWEAYKEDCASYAGTSVILLHEADAYVAELLDMTVAGTMDLDEERQISAGEVADIMTVINEQQVNYVFAEELYGSDMGNTIAKETAVSVIYLDTLNRGDYQKDSYLQGLKANLQLLKDAAQ